MDTDIKTSSEVLALVDVCVASLKGPKAASHDALRSLERVINDPHHDAFNPYSTPTWCCYDGLVDLGHGISSGDLEWWIADAISECQISGDPDCRAYEDAERVAYVRERYASYMSVECPVYFARRIESSSGEEAWLGMCLTATPADLVTDLMGVYRSPQDFEAELLGDGMHFGFIWTDDEILDRIRSAEEGRRA